MSIKRNRTSQNNTAKASTASMSSVQFALYLLVGMSGTFVFGNMFAWTGDFSVEMHVLVVGVGKFMLGAAICAAISVAGYAYNKKAKQGKASSIASGLFILGAAGAAYLLYAPLHSPKTEHEAVIWYVLLEFGLIVAFHWMRNHPLRIHRASEDMATASAVTG